MFLTQLCFKWESALNKSYMLNRVILILAWLCYIIDNFKMNSLQRSLQIQNSDCFYRSMQKSQLTYWIMNLRTKRSYLVFQILQLLLALIILISALSNINHFRTTHVLWMQLVLLILMGIDLFIIRLISQRSIIKGLMEKIDLGIFVVFAAMLVWLAMQQDDDNESQMLETDDVIIIVVVGCRYALQIYSIVRAIKKTRINRDILNQIKQIDLNQPPNVSQVYHAENDDVFRNKLTKNFQNKSQNQKNQVLNEQFD